MHRLFGVTMPDERDYTYTIPELERMKDLIDSQDKIEIDSDTALELLLVLEKQFIHYKYENVHKLINRLQEMERNNDSKTT